MSSPAAQENVEAAAALGFTGIHFSDPGTLRRDLRELGLSQPG